MVGATHYSSGAFAELSGLMRSGRIGMVQVPYGPVARAAEQEILPLAAELGLGVLVMSPLSGGGLARWGPPRRTLAPLRAFGVETWAAIPATRRPARMAENAAAGRPPWFGPEERELVARLAAGTPREAARRLKHKLLG